MINDDEAGMGSSIRAIFFRCHLLLYFLQMTLSAQPFQQVEDIEKLFKMVDQYLNGINVFICIYNFVKFNLNCFNLL